MVSVKFSFLGKYKSLDSPTDDDEMLVEAFQAMEREAGIELRDVGDGTHAEKIGATHRYRLSYVREYVIHAADLPVNMQEERLALIDRSQQCADAERKLSTLKSGLALASLQEGNVEDLLVRIKQLQFVAESAQNATLDPDVDEFERSIVRFLELDAYKDAEVRVKSLLL